MASPKSDKIIWYPTYIGNVLAVTAMMSPHAICAHFLITTHLWNAGGSLPDDDEKLARISHLSKEEWAAAKPEIWPLFKVKNGQLTCPRIVEGAQKTLRKIQDASRAGRASGLKRKEKAEERRGNDRSTSDRADDQRSLNGRSNDRSTSVATELPTESQLRASDFTYPGREYLGDSSKVRDGDDDAFRPWGAEQ